MRTLLSVFLILFSELIIGQTHAPDSVFHLSVIPDSSEVTVGKIILKGNKITRDKIILRELEFKPGKTYTRSDFEALMRLSRENLMNRSLFNFVTFTPIYNNGKYDIKIEVIERWYIWPIPLYGFAEGNFNAWWENKDLSHLDYGIDFRFENFRGNMEFLNVIVMGGFNKTLAVYWNKPYLNKKQTLGLNVAGGTVYNRSIATATIDNKLHYTTFENSYARKWFFAQAGITYRPKYRFLHTLTLRFNRQIFNDSLLTEAPGFIYDKTAYDYFSFEYIFKLDNRDYKPYPLAGYYFDIRFNKRGFGILSQDVNTFILQSAFDQYIHLYKRWYFAYNISARYFSPTSTPYYFSSGLGQDNMEIRGYDLYVVDGQNIGLMRSNLKFEILPKTDYTIPWIKTEKFGKIFFALYVNLFFDMAYVSNRKTPENNPLANQLLYGTGIGIDLVTYYDVVFRLEYAVNKQKDRGFFVSLVAPI